ncbi:hypothetical protein SLS56_007985 [Neofusicoccum ribis]|uniref:HMG box domain-containing protein n=1 Tax=Neofusicoccum ribis TaxID=45134 RepID=A0ABR3SLC4_9PEZI
MLARTALARLRAKVPSAAARDVAQLSRQLRTALAATNPIGNATVAAPLTVAQLQRIRGYATATKTKTRASSAKTAKTTAAKKTVAAKKKPATKTKAAAKPKKKAVAKPKKKAVAKPKKKELTEAQQERLQKRKERAEEQKKKDEIKQLKLKALQEPKMKPQSVFSILLAETVQKELTKGSTGGIGPIAKSVSDKYKNLSSSELEHYNRLSNEAIEENKKTYEKWLKTHTPMEIKQANNARRLLKTRLPSYSKHQIQDPRVVRQPAPAYIQFYTERYASGDFKNMSPPEAAKLVGQEWSALSPSGKEKYESMAAEDRMRYAREYESTYGEKPAFLPKAKA